MRTPEHVTDYVRSLSDRALTKKLEGVLADMEAAGATYRCLTPRERTTLRALRDEATRRLSVQ